MNYKYQVGTVVFQNWTIKRRIGAGSFGEVFEIQREDFGQIYKAALKVITVPQSDDEYQTALEDGMSAEEAKQYFYSVVEEVVREFAIMANFKATANVVSYEDHAVIQHKDGCGWDILIRMELLTPLKTYTASQPFTRRDIIRLGIDMLKALELCQKYNVIHRDIKPENIFVSSNGDFKLGDFGIARTIEKTTSGMSKKGTYTYMAPEVYLGKEYGFSVDTYSLGLVLYRLLNKNRAPFLPAAPEPITHNKQEEALVKRMSGEKIPKPFYAEGRLAEIVLKACAFDASQRYSSPMEMREELEAILYQEDEAEFIYPAGDEVELPENKYLSKTPQKEIGASDSIDENDKTESVFDNVPRGLSNHPSYDNTDKTESAFGECKLSNGTEQADRTESIFGERAVAKAAQAKKEMPKADSSKKKSNKPIVAAVAGVLLVGVAAFAVMNINAQKQEKYETYMTEGMAACKINPDEAQELFLKAQELISDRPDAYVSYAFALYSDREYDACITYIEDTLAMGKEYDTAVQNSLSEILASAYFEKEDYAAAASFFRLSTAGGDITVSAMRDYAVSLGRLGDVEAAKEVLQRMFDAGASDDVTNYVQAEVDYALKDYQKAENGFQTVLNTTMDKSLQKRSLRSLSELYRDCAALQRTGQSPIVHPATKAVDLLSQGIAAYELQSDSTIWEMLALAYFEAYHTDASVPKSYLTKSAECFAQVIDMGVQKDYLYSNLYTIYYELGDYNSAEDALQSFEAAFPNSYMPHAFRAMMLITMENGKAQDARNYSKAVKEYEAAKELLTSADDKTYYLQLESLINQLKNKGWI